VTVIAVFVRIAWPNSAAPGYRSARHRLARGRQSYVERWTMTMNACWVVDPACPTSRTALLTPRPVILSGC